MIETEIISNETGVAVIEPDAYTEIYLTTDGRIQLHVEDGADAAEPVYTLEQAKDLMVAIGRAIWVAENEYGAS